jgi:uncharacterized lipoprotein YddW (UPF0748 family)
MKPAQGGVVPSGIVLRRWLPLLFVALPAVCLGSGAPEVRGLWVVRTGLVSPAAIDHVVDQAVSGGFNTLLVQVRGRGDAFYRSDLVSRSVLIRGTADFDPLAHLLTRARARNLQVHAWVNVLLTAHFGQPLAEGHILVRHPEWAMVPRSVARAALQGRAKDRLRLVSSASRGTDAEGFYISPAAPGVPEHLEEVVRELLARYAVDGLHLDFIRYPGPEFDYSPAALESFRKATAAKGDLLSLPAAAPHAWAEHRRGLVTSLVDRLSRTARKERPQILVSAAVVPSDVDAIHQKGQAWTSWRGVDALCPMTYTPDARIFRDQVERARATVGKGPSLWAGVGAYRLNIDQIVANIRTARDLGTSGVVLFSHESLDDAALAQLRKEAFTAPVAASAPSLLGSLKPQP